MAHNELLLKNQLCHQLYSASNALQRAYKDLLKPLDITYPQYLIMMALWEKDGVNIQAICEATFFDSGTLTPLLQKLKAKGLIEIKPLKEDRRNKLVFLSKKGRGLEQKALQIPEGLMCLVSAKGLELGSLRQQIEQLHQALLGHESKS